MTTPTMQRARRPLWVVVVVALIGVVLVSGIVALASHRFFYVVLLYSLLLGVAGGLFAWVVLEEVGQEGTWVVATVGAVLGIAMYLLHHHLWYRLSVSGQPDPVGWWAYVRAQAAAGVLVTNRSGSGITVGTGLTWAIWTFEAAVAAVSGWLTGRNMQMPA